MGFLFGDLLGFSTQCVCLYLSLRPGALKYLGPRSQAARGLG